MHAEFLVTQDQMTFHENLRRLMVKLEKRESSGPEPKLKVAKVAASEQAAEEASAVDGAAWDSDDDGPPPMCDP